MSIKPLMDEIALDVKDIINTDFAFYNTRAVPSSEDSNLTFENGVEKRGKSFDTCVLYTDIRDSVSLSKTHQYKTMGKIYTAFIKGVIKAAHHHSGFVRNIIGDRVMVVFPPMDCFKNSVNCAISINHLANKIINKEFKGINFRCGIGIDFGRIRVVKVGVPKYGKERVDNKNLVWVGRPANIASRLTDFANKNVHKQYFEVTYYPIDSAKMFIERLVNKQLSKDSTLGQYLDKSHSSMPQTRYKSGLKKELLSSEEFLERIRLEGNGEMSLKVGKLNNLYKRKKSFLYKPILITGEVYKGFKKELPKDSSFVNNWWQKQDVEINDYLGNIWGAGLTWKLD